MIEKVCRQDGHRLSVGLSLKDMAEGGQFAAQSLKILDNAVVDDGDPVRGDRVGVSLGRQAMGCPTGVTDADHPLHRLAVEPPSKVHQLALGAPALDAAVDEGRDASRIIATVFEAAEPFDQPRSYCFL